MSEPSNQQNIYDGQGFLANNPQAPVFQGVSNSTVNINYQDLGLDRISRVEMNLYRSTPNFVGRQEELDRLHKILQQQEGAVISAVSGMGGVGKTQLAVEYATRHAADYPGGVCWLRAREQDLATQIIQIAEFDLNLKILDNPQVRSLPPETIVQQCWQAWQPDGLVLVVLDDVTDWVMCQRFLPKLSRFRLLLTTRIQRLDADLFEIALDVLSIDEAVELLAKLEKHGRVERDRATAIQLCEALGRLPLGIELIGRYLFSRRALSLSKMLEQLQRQKLAIEALERSPQYAMTAQLGVKAAFELTWQPLSEDSQTVARLLGYFALAEIPWQVAEAMMQRVKGEEYSIFEAQTELENASVVQIVAEKTDVCKLHPLVREFLREKEEHSIETTWDLTLVDAFVTELISLASQMPYGGTARDILAFKPICTHVQEIVENCAEGLHSDVLISAFVGLALFYENQGLFTQAEPWRMLCLQVAESRFKGDHSQVAVSLNDLALLYKTQGRLSEAEPLYVRALEMRQRLCKGDHSAVAQSLSNLALLYQAQERLSEAELFHVQALEMRQRLFGGDHPDIGNSLNNLATLYDDQGRLSEAEPLYVRALEMCQRFYTGDNSAVATSLHNLAYLYHSQGRWAEAESLYLQALEIRQRLFEDNHPDIAGTTHNLARLYQDQGRIGEAEPLLFQALSMRRNFFGRDHLAVATSINNLALLYQAQGRISEAELLYMESLEIRQRLFEGDHSSVAMGLNNLAYVYQAQGRLSEAEPLYFQALKMYQRLFRGDHPRLALGFNNLAHIYQSQGRLGEAEPLFIEALKMRQRLFESDHPDLACSLNNLAHLYTIQERWTEAELLYVQSLEMRQRLFANAHSDVAWSLNNLAYVYDSQGRFEEAINLYEQAVEIFERILGTDHPNTQTVRANLENLRQRL